MPTSARDGVGTVPYGFYPTLQGPLVSRVAAWPPCVKGAPPVGRWGIVKEIACPLVWLLQPFGKLNNSL